MRDDTDVFVAATRYVPSLSYMSYESSLPFMPWLCRPVPFIPELRPVTADVRSRPGMPRMLSYPEYPEARASVAVLRPP